MREICFLNTYRNCVAFGPLITFYVNCLFIIAVMKLPIKSKEANLSFDQLIKNVLNLKLNLVIPSALKDC